MKSSWCEYEYKSRSVGIGWHKYIIYSIHIYIYVFYVFPRGDDIDKQMYLDLDCVLE